MRRPRVLHVITGLQTGGAEMMLYKIVSRTADRAAVVSLTGDGPMAERIRETGADLWTLGMTPGIPDPRAVGRLTALMRRWQPDVVQTWMYHADLLGGIAARLAGGVPTVWNIRQSTLDAEASKVHTRLTLRLCARLSHSMPRRIVCCSETGRSLHGRLGYDVTRIEVIPNGFDTRLFRPDPPTRRATRAELGIPEAAPVIGLIARLDPQKDHANFFAAAARLRTEWPDARFLLCGTDMTWETEPVRGWVEAHGMGDRVYLLGRRTDVHRVMTALDVATSSSYQEGFPNVVGEAMSTAVPCVVTDAGDSAMIVADTGVVVPPRDPDALAGGWAATLRLGAEGRTALGMAARRRIELHFSLQAVVDRYESLYSEVSLAGPVNARPV